MKDKTIENFKEIGSFFKDGFAVINLFTKKDINLILSDIFFNSDKYPIGVIDTKKFAYNNEEKLNLDIELTIKGTTRVVNTELLVIKLTNDLVQIKSELKFSRNDFNIGTGNWKNTTILKDKIKINSNIFLFKE